VLDKNGGFEGAAADLANAKQLGIEALLRVLDMRQYDTLIGLAASMPARPLPSEDSK